MISLPRQKPTWSLRPSLTIYNRPTLLAEALAMCNTTVFGRRRALPSLESITKELQFEPLDFQHQSELSKRAEERLTQVIVKHEYHDRSNEVASTHNEQQLRGGPTTHFPSKLHEMLEQVQADGLEHIVSWQPHGRCFLVHDAKEFVCQVLSKYFKQSMMASFQRQLNLYGFHRLTKGADKGGYYHEYFLRGRSDLCEKIHRMKVKGTGVRGRSNPDAEPNFWKMSWIAHDGTTKPSEATYPNQIHSSTSHLTPPDSSLWEPCAVRSLMGMKDDEDLDFFEGKYFHAVDQQPRTVTAAGIDSFAETEEYSAMIETQLPETLHRDILEVLDDEVAFEELLQRLVQEA